jgi:hypothetical protein
MTRASSNFENVNHAQVLKLPLQGTKNGTGVSSSSALRHLFTHYKKKTYFFTLSTNYFSSSLLLFICRSSVVVGGRGRGRGRGSVVPLILCVGSAVGRGQNYWQSCMLAIGVQTICSPG